MAAELLQNGDFASSTGWTLGDQWGIAGGKLTRTSSGVGEDSAEQLEADLTDDLLIGTTYVLVITIDSITGGTVRPWLGNVQGPKLSEVGTYTIYFTPTDVTDGLRFQSDGPRSIDTPLAVEHISNGDFSGGDTGWTLESQWAIAGGKLTRTPGTGDEILGSELLVGGDITFTGGAGNWVPTTGYFSTATGVLWIKETTSAGGWGIADTDFSAVLKDNTTYRATIEVSNLSGTMPMRMDIVGAATYGPSFSNVSANGTYSTAISAVTVVGEGPVLRIRKDTTAGITQSCYLDNASLKEVTGYSPTGPDTASQVAGDLAVAFVEGKTYRLYFTVDSISGGTVTPSLAGTSGTAVSAAGDHEQDIVAGASGGVIFSGSTSLTIQMDDISVLELVSGLTIQMDDASLKLSGVDAGEGQGSIDYDYKVTCEICGFHFHYYEVRKNWKNQWVCKPPAGNCYEARHAQDFVRAKVDDAVDIIARPEYDWEFIDESPTQDDL
ncbi:MAG: hypothetical protein KOO63_05565 [Bacteroidales bacterium]|nr:hypothetical protein [Candidatus Latescibacterota bacterium]